MPDVFGRDLSCRERITTTRMVGGRTLLIDSIMRRLSTPRGTLFGGDEESAYGIDLAAYVGAVSPAVALAAVPAVVEGELLKDSRIAAVRVSASRSTTADGVRLELVVDVTPADGTETFPLTIAIGDVTVALLGGAG